VSENLSIESPEFDLIKKETGQSTRDGIQLLWTVANEEARQRRRGVRLAQEMSKRKVLSLAPAANQDNLDWDGSGIVLFTGTTSVNLTGLRNGAQGVTVVLHNIGTGTITLKHESASSEAENRLDTAADADVTLSTGKTVILRHLNGRWRQEVQA
jgi:hypothetical protein